jgi:hypothetical protein
MVDQDHAPSLSQHAADLAEPGGLVGPVVKRHTVLINTDGGVSASATR